MTKGGGKFLDMTASMNFGLLKFGVKFQLNQVNYLIGKEVSKVYPHLPIWIIEIP